jgi:hypothetical protein
MTPTTDTPREALISEWARRAREASRTGQDGLVRTALARAAVLAAEGERPLHEILTEGVQTWTA